MHETNTAHDVQIERPVLHFTRPSILRPKAFVDSWVGVCVPGHLVVYLNNQPIALFPGSLLDQTSLNDQLFALHHRYPRNAY